MDTLTTGIDRTSRQRRYSPQDIARVLATLAEQGGNIAATSRIEGVPEQTIRHWSGGTVSVPSTEVVAQEKALRAAKWDEVQDLGVTTILEKLPEASARDAAVVAGIAVDKAALLRAENGTNATPEADNRLALFRQHFGQSQVIAQELHLHVHLAPSAPAAPAPIPVQAIETTGNAGETGGTGAGSCS